LAQAHFSVIAPSLLPDHDFGIPAHIHQPVLTLSNFYQKLKSSVHQYLVTVFRHWE